MILPALREAVRTVFRRCWDKEIIRADQHPASNHMGLHHFGIRTILDIGANTGQFASEVTQWLPGVRVYSFEPLPSAFAELRTAQLPGVREFRPLHCALGETNGEVEMTETVDDNTSSSLLQITPEFTDERPRLKKLAQVKVRLGRLDHVVREEGIILEPEILIKMDVQGFEDRVIRGGSETFAQARACIVEVIFDHCYEGQATFFEITRLLHELGLEYAGNFSQNHSKDGHVNTVDAFYLRKSKRLPNPSA